MMNPLIHIGYQKTASSWLQKYLFRTNSSIFGHPCENAYGEAHQHSIYGRKFEFDPSKVLEIFESGIKLCEENGQIPVISNENLVGNPLVPYNYANETAEKIHQTFPNAKILIFIREQKKMISSLYRQYVREGGKLALEEFLNGKSRKPGFWPTFIPERLEYDKLIACYQKLFGSEKILVLSFENFKKSNSKTVEKILQFIERNDDPEALNSSRSGVNVGHKGLTLELRRRLNQFMPEPYFGESKPSLSHRISEKALISFNSLVPQKINDAIESKTNKLVEEFVGDFYVESNLQTYKLTGINYQ